jgi:hypothetical protein
MRAFNHLVILKPREDLERDWNSSTIITPDSALVSADSVQNGLRSDHTAIAAVHRLPEDYTGPELNVGDGVLLPLFSMSKVVCIDGELFLVAHKEAICARVTNLGKPSEKIEALNGWILCKRDQEAFQRRMYGGLTLTDTDLDDGIPLDGGAQGIVRGVLERIVSVGSAYLNPAVQKKPKQTEKALAFFNPLSSARFRRFQQVYRLVPHEAVQFELED